MYRFYDFIAVKFFLLLINQGLLTPYLMKNFNRISFYSHIRHLYLIESSNLDCWDSLNEECNFWYSAQQGYKYSNDYY